jgi:general secretion pathway protein A
LRLLSNMNDGRTLKLQIILSGQPDLHTILQRIDMTQFAQRIVVDYHLKPLSEADTANCIRHRVQVAGGHPSLFTNKACALVHRLSRGNPRLINQVSDIALTYGYAEQARVITCKLVAQAALDRSKGGILPLASREELIDLAVAPQDPSEVKEPLPLTGQNPNLGGEDASVGHSLGSPGSPYDQGVVLKNQGRLREAVDMFHLAARDKSMWLKTHAQVGLCYSRMKELPAAIEAFRTALNDEAAAPKDVVEVLYFLGRSLETSGETGEALEIYQRISQTFQDFKDVSSRIYQLSPNSKSDKRRDRARPNESWLSGAIDNFQRFLIGTQK